jgi:hypothetical protein
MPPWFVEMNIGIQEFKNDLSLSKEEIDKLAHWADSRAPQGNPADMPPPLDFDSADRWTIGEPDLVVRSPEVVVPAVGPDRWTGLRFVPTGLAEDRYVAAVEVREVNDVPRSEAANTVGGRYVFHHLNYSSVVQGENGAADQRSATWPVHEVGRNADLFPPEAGRLMAANSVLSLDSAHLHANGRETRAHLEFAFKFFPKGYTPLYRRSSLRSMGNGIDLDVKPNRHVTFDPDQMKTWIETRPYANSPWSPPYLIPEPPPDGTWTVRATFREPGPYVLRAVASDGSLFTYANVTVNVTR